MSFFISTFQTCPASAVGNACSGLWLLDFVVDPYYQLPPLCVKTDPTKPNQVQCLPRGFQSIIPPKTTDVNIWTIKNSIFDNCSPTDGADAGCGKDLQCNFYKIGNLYKRWTCEPIQKVGGYSTGVVPISAKKDYESASWHQTCGQSTFSAFLSIKCDQSTDAGPLVCSPVWAYVNGFIARKSICIKPAEVAALQKRAVFKTAFCYSGCPPGLGYTKMV